MPVATEVGGGAIDPVRLDGQLCFMLYACSRKVIKAYQPMLSELDLTYPQYLVLMVLWQWRQSPPEDATVSALGKRLSLDSGTLTPLLKRLQHKGLVVRCRDRGDERRVLLAVTDAGAELEPQAARWLSAAKEGLVEGHPLGDERMVVLREQLVELYRAL